MEDSENVEIEMITKWARHAFRWRFQHREKGEFRLFDGPGPRGFSIAAMTGEAEIVLDDGSAIELKNRTEHSFTARKAVLRTVGTAPEGYLNYVPGPNVPEHFAYDGAKQWTFLQSEQSETLIVQRGEPTQIRLCLDTPKLFPMGIWLDDNISSSGMTSPDCLIFGPKDVKKDVANPFCIDLWAKSVLIAHAPVPDDPVGAKPPLDMVVGRYWI